MGIVDIPTPTFFGKAFGTVGYFGLTFAFVTLAVLTSIYFSRTWGRLAMEAFGEDETAAKAMGINVAKFKIYAFAISSAYAGIAGALWAHYVGSVFPENFGFDRSIDILAMLVLGGLGTIRGAVFGALLLQVLPEALRFIQDYRMLVSGAVLALMMVFQPMGLLGKGSFLYLRSLGILRHFRRGVASGAP
jgi:branched-chain amino acid transport system permease protein